ncbi:MAG: TonB-dependent receptor [Pseudomonadota bacterium]|nr:TonB-dependent receptor [Pseudomonadota bacterium]
MSTIDVSVRKILARGACTALAGTLAAGVTPAAEQQVVELEEVIVTAQYREESLQETPIAITAITAEDLEARAVTSAYEVAYTVPNASFRPAQAAFGNTMTAFVRGIGQNDFDFAFEPGVGIYIDDVYHPFTLGSSIELLDLERVEVLRGPQGTLFGRGSIGGAVRFVTRQPRGDDTGSISLTVGEYDRLDLRASYDFALSEQLFARVTGISSSRGGYQDVIDFACAFPAQAGTLPVMPVNQARGCKRGTQGGEDVLGGRGTLSWLANDSFELGVTAEFLKSDAEPKADALVNVVPDSPWSLNPAVPYDERFIPPNPYVTYATYNDPQSGLTFEPRNTLEKKFFSGRADWDLGSGMRASLIGAYTEMTTSLVSDADGSPLNVQQTYGVQTVDFHTVELRVSGRAMDRVNWTAGGFYYSGDSVNDQIVSIPFLSLVSDGVPPTDPSQPFVNAHNVHDSRNYSAFLHSVWDMTETVSLTAGLRYSDDRKVVAFDNSRVQNPRVVVAGDKLDWRVGLDIKLSDDLMTYASASTGYRPGSYNPRPFQWTQVVAVDQEKSTAYEAGVKADLLGRRLRVNAAVFYTDWKARILPVAGTECLVTNDAPPPAYDTVDPSTPGAVQDSLGNWCMTTVSRTFYDNEPGEVMGGEVEFLWQPWRGLTLNGVYGMLDWKSDDIDSGGTPFYVPDSNWSVGAGYVIGLASGSTLTPRLDLYGQSQVCTNSTVASCSGGYGLLNARVEWANPGRTWTIAAGATNVTDKQYFLNKFDLTAFGQPHTEGQPGRPREWYLSFTRNFN